MGSSRGCVEAELGNKVSDDKEMGVKAAEASVNCNRVRARICLAERVGDHWYDHRPQPLTPVWLGKTPRPGLSTSLQYSEG